MKRTALLRRTPLRSMSKKRQKESRIYAKKRLVYLEANPICEVCLHRPATQIHHKKRRHSGNYLNEETFLGVCFSCHEWIERNPIQSRALGYLG